MQKALENVLFGLFFGIGFTVAVGVCHFLAGLLSGAKVPALQ